MDSEETICEFGIRFGKVMAAGCEIGPSLFENPPLESIVEGIRAVFGPGDNVQADNIVVMLEGTSVGDDGTLQGYDRATDDDWDPGTPAPFEPGFSDTIDAANRFLHMLSLEERRTLISSLEFCLNCARPLHAGPCEDPESSA